MALKDLIATPGERIASLIGKEWRISDAEVLARIRDLADEAVEAEREACAKIADAKYDPNNITQTAVCSAVADAIRNRR